MTEIPEHLLKRAQEAREKTVDKDPREERLARIMEAMQNRPPRYTSYSEATAISAKDTVKKAQRLAARYPPDRERIWDITLTRFNSWVWGWEVSEVEKDRLAIRTSVKGSALTMAGARKKAEKYIRKRGF